MQTITVPKTKDGFQASVRKTEEPRTWALEWAGTLHERRAYRMLTNAETAVLGNDGERLAVTCPPEQEPLKEKLGRWPESEVTRTGACYLLQLTVTAKDGFLSNQCKRTPGRGSNRHLACSRV